MKVFLHPTGLHSHAMLRVAAALEKYKPDDVTVVGRPHAADVQIFHVIGSDVLHLVQGREYAVIQYCFRSANGNLEEWQEFWRKSRVVWSYYDLHDKVKDVPFYFSPLGVDGNIFQFRALLRNAVMTSGYVSGPGAEPIEEVGVVAEQMRMPVIHVGPPTIEGMKTYPRRRTAYLNVPDNQLVDLYNKCLWVSGMRYVEGFEMPVIEGLACGARPICFDREDMRQWYDGHAVFVPECNGGELRSILTNILQSPPNPVSLTERAEVLDRFNWETIARGFWQAMNV